MDTDSKRVVVTKTASATITVVHHRDFPEIRAEGSSPKEAASHLVNKLACTLDTALTEWRRDTLDGAIADVKAFIEQEA
jgi:hypothetical protein